MRFLLQVNHPCLSILYFWQYRIIAQKFERLNEICGKKQENLGVGSDQAEKQKIKCTGVICRAVRFVIVFEL